jgi:predicted RNase H-like HicB family nuclease
MKATNHKTVRKKPKGQKNVRHTFPVVIEKDADGFFVFCPTMQGCSTDGDTLEEAVKNLQEVIQLHIEDRLECGEAIPGRDLVSVMTMEVEV